MNIVLEFYRYIKNILDLINIIKINKNIYVEVILINILHYFKFLNCIYIYPMRI